MSAGRAELAARYGIDVFMEPDPLPPPELFPKRTAWIVRGEHGRRILDTAVWGFPPPVAARAPVTNVRNYLSPFWRTAMANPERRCLVPFTDFCEWEGEKGGKVARWFSVPSRPIVSFAGVWRPLGDGGRACAFLTTEPNPLVAPVHPKAMPVLLHEEDEGRWLSCPFDEAVTLAQPFPSQLMAVA